MTPSGRGLRVVFAGTPFFADRALEALLSSRHAVIAVLTQPDRPAGRGQKPAMSPVKTRALAAGLPVLQPQTLRIRAAPAASPTDRPVGPEASGAGGAATDAAADAEAAAIRLAQRNREAGDALAALTALAPDVIVVAAYGLILPPSVLALPPRGCLNIHASLLPRWRGAAPIVRAIEAGDRETGICIMRMEEGLDTGPVGRVRRTPIAPDETAGQLHDRLAILGAEAIVEVLDALAAGATGGNAGAATGAAAGDPVGTSDAAAIRFVPQPAVGITYAGKIAKGEARIDWTRDAAAVACQIRAFDPQPGAFGTLRRDAATVIRCFDAVAVDDGRQAGGGDAATAGPDPAPDPAPAPGTILAADDAGLVVACGRGRVNIRTLQRAGGRRLPVAAFRRGFPVSAGDAWVCGEAGAAPP